MLDPSRCRLHDAGGLQEIPCEAGGGGKVQKLGIMRHLLRVVLFATIACCVALFGLGAHAQEAGRAGGNPCREDMERLCSDVKPGGGAKIRCLKDHEDELSDACRAQIAEHSQRGNGKLKACGDDAKRLCPKEEPGHGGVLRCLRDHEADLSSECRDALGQAQPQH